MDASKSPFFSLSPCEITLLAAAVAFFLTEGLNSTEREVLSNFLSSVSQNIQIFDAQERLLNE